MDHHGMRFWTFGGGFATKQLLLTGTLLTIIFSSFFLTTLQAFRKTTAGFRWFWMFHMTGIALVYPLLLIHGTLRGRPIFLYFALLPLALYLFDVSMRRKNIYKANVLRWKVFDDDGQQITELVLERPRGFSYTPGQYAELKFAPISLNEWHPFTIASAPGEVEEENKEVVFYIKNSGRWTGALMDYARAFDLSKSQTPTEILIRGPNGAPAQNYGDYKHIIVIGSGVGVTPLLSIWKGLVNKAKPSLLTEKRKARKSTGLMMQQGMDESISIMDQSISMLTNIKHSEIAPMDSSTPIDFFQSYTLNLESHNRRFKKHSGSPTITKRYGKIRTKSIFMAKLLESMTVSLSLFVLFVLGETATILFQLAGWYLMANIFAAMLSVIAFVVHSATLVVWAIAVNWKVYIRLFRCWLELTIVLVNCSALWFSIHGCINGSGKGPVTYATASYISVAFVIALQAVRIFHIFYMCLKTTATPGSKNKKEEDRSTQSKIITKSTRESSETRKPALEMVDGTKFCSVEGILINRKYSNMKFAARTLLPPILKDGLTDVFSMQFYGTREKPKEVEEGETGLSEHSLVGKMMGSMGASIDVRRSDYYKKKENHDDFFCAGRPDWNRIFLKAISKAHVTNEEGECVGIFFCGSPAIAKDLQLEARRVTAQHQFAMKRLDGKACKCKLIVHSENF